MKTSAESAGRQAQGRGLRVEDHTTKEFYKNVILFKGGAKAMEIYKALHPEGKFRD